MGTYIVLFILCVIIGLVLYAIVKETKKGGTCCDGNCFACSMSCKARENNGENTEDKE